MFRFYLGDRYRRYWWFVADTFRDMIKFWFPVEMVGLMLKWQTTKGTQWHGELWRHEVKIASFFSKVLLRSQGITPFSGNMIICRTCAFHGIFVGWLPWFQLSPLCSKPMQSFNCGIVSRPLWDMIIYYKLHIDLYNSSLYVCLHQNDVQDTIDSTLDTCRSSTGCSTIEEDPYRLAMEFHPNNGTLIDRDRLLQFCSILSYCVVVVSCFSWDWLESRIHFWIPHNVSVWPRMTLIVPVRTLKEKIMKTFLGKIGWSGRLAASVWVTTGLAESSTPPSGSLTFMDCIQLQTCQMVG